MKINNLKLYYCVHRSRSSRTTSEDSGAPRSFIDDGFETDSADADDQSLYGSQYSFCSCSHCNEPKKNPLYGRELRMSFCER